MQISLPDGRRGQILASMLTITLLAALWFGLAGPLIGWYHGRGEELGQRRALLAHSLVLAGTLPELEHQRANTRPGTPELLPGTTDGLAAAAMQSAVQAMAAISGVELATMETLPAETRGTYRRIGLRVSVAAPWPALIELLRKAQQGQPPMLVDDVQLHAEALGEAMDEDAIGEPDAGHTNAQAPTSRIGSVKTISATFTLLAFRAALPEAGS